jgi:signal transduction histidine kinase
MVADTGVGIPQADLARIMAGQPLPESRHAGAGLGLSLVKSFIELHGGNVEISSAPNEGTTVTCTLPAGGG